METELSPQEQSLAKSIPKDPDPVAVKVQLEYQAYKTAKHNKEEEALRAHRNILGVYGSDVKFDSGSQAFVQITSPRVQTAIAMIMPIVTPQGWTVDPTPEPDIKAVELKALAAGATPEQAKDEVKKVAEKAAEKLTNKIADGLTETRWATKLMQCVTDCVSYGTGVVCGPYVCEEIEEDGTKKYEPELTYESWWDVYPDPSARCVEDCQSILVRKLMSLAQMRDLRKKSGFIAKAIDELVARYGERGNWVPEWWEHQIRQANGSDIGQTYSQNKYQIIIRWGLMSGKDMKSCGAKISDDLLEEQIMCQVWCCDNKVIYIANSELHRERLPFYMVPYIYVSHSILGRGLPSTMFDSQDCINACERAKMNNLALASRPQAIVYPHMLTPGFNNLEITAGKVWPVQASELPQQRPVEFYTPDFRVDQIDAVERAHIAFVAEQTCVPALLMGQSQEGTHNRTSSGAAMQFNAAVTPMKTTIMHFEHFLFQPMIASMAKFYEMYDEDPEIVGDHEISTKGLTGLMNREALANEMMQFMQIIGTVPGWAERTDTDRIYELMVRAKGLTEESIALSEEEVAKRREQAQQQQSTAQLADATAQAELNKKIKAETAPRDAALELLKQAPENSPLKLELMKQVASMFEIMTPQLEASIDQQQELLMMEMRGMAAKYGAEYAQTVEPTPIIPGAGTGNVDSGNGQPQQY